MIYLLYGEDTDRSQEKLEEVIGEFRKRNPALNFYKFDAEENDSALIRNVIESQSLFAAKKLIVVKYVSGARDRGALYRIFEKIKKADDIVLVLWDRKFEAELLEEIRPYCEKIQEFKLTKKTPEIPEANIFSLGDAFFSSQREGLRKLLYLLDRGHDDFSLFLYLANYARTLLTVKSCVDKGRAVPTNLGIHPYVVKKAASLVRTLSTDHLHTAFGGFSEEDNLIKTGLLKPRDSLLRILFKYKL